MFIFADNILTLWMGAEFAAVATDILRVLIFAFAILATSIAPYYYLNGTGYVRLNALFGLVSGAMVTLVAILFIPWIGIIGAAFSRLANIPISIISRTIVHNRLLNDKRWYAGFSILLPVITSFTFGFATIWYIGALKLSIIHLLFWFVLLSIIGITISGTLGYLVNHPRALINSGK
jgi:O-antigen/teichoic acid export membrane protein